MIAVGDLQQLVVDVERDHLPDDQIGFIVKNVLPKFVQILLKFTCARLFARALVTCARPIVGRCAPLLRLPRIPGRDHPRVRLTPRSDLDAEMASDVNKLLEAILRMSCAQLQQGRIDVVETVSRILTDNVPYYQAMGKVRAASRAGPSDRAPRTRLTRSHVRARAPRVALAWPAQDMLDHAELDTDDSTEDSHSLYDGSDGDGGTAGVGEITVRRHAAPRARATRARTASLARTERTRAADFVAPCGWAPTAARARPRPAPRSRPSTA